MASTSNSGTLSATLDQASPASPASPGDTAQLAAQWAGIRGVLQQEAGDVIYRTWLRDMTLVGVDGDELTILLPTDFKRNWVQTNYGDRLTDLWRAENKAIRRLDFRTARAEHKTISCLAADVTAGSSILEPSRVEPQAADRPERHGGIGASLDPLLTFDRFVIGKPNEFAHACARRVAEVPNGPGFNPLFLYGDVGLGKTHLMNAIGLDLTREGRAPAEVIYMSAEKFMYDFITAIRSDTTMDFKNKLRSVDVLMIDDLQFLVGKDNTQEEFFHTFNALIGAGRQIVVSADKSPSDLEGIDARLRTRLGCGMVADLHATTYELRLSILEAKAGQAPVSVPARVLEFLAHKVATNVRVLEGCLNRLVAHASVFQREVTMEGAQEILHDILKVHDRKITIEEIQKRVAEHWGIRLTDMTSARRARTVARPRQVAMYLAKHVTDRSLPEIGRMFGNRDHTTVMHGIKRVTELMEQDSDFREKVELMLGLLKR